MLWFHLTLHKHRNMCRHLLASQSNCAAPAGQRCCMMMICMVTRMLMAVKHTQAQHLVQCHDDHCSCGHLTLGWLEFDLWLPHWVLGYDWKLHPWGLFFSFLWERPQHSFSSPLQSERLYYHTLKILTTIKTLQGIKFIFLGFSYLQVNIKQKQQMTK